MVVNFNEEEAIKILKEINVVDFYNTYTDSTTDFSEPRKYCDAIEIILDLYNKEKEKNKKIEDKIKAKIEEYKKLINECPMNDEEIFCKECTEKCGFNQTIDVMQSLLEKE